MKQERFSEEKIVGILREAEKSEKAIADLCREHGIAEQTFYRTHWIQFIALRA